MTTKSRDTSNEKPHSVEQEQLAALLLELLPGKPGQPRTEAFKQELRAKFGGAPLRKNRSSRADLERVARSLLSQLEQQVRPKPSHARAPENAAHAPQSRSASPPRGRDETTPEKAQSDSEKFLNRFRYEHPAIIAQRLRRLPAKSQEAELNQFSGELARQVRFLIWQLDQAR